MSTGYSVYIDGKLSTIETDTNGKVTVEKYPCSEYDNSMCLLRFKDHTIEAVRSGDELMTIIYRMS